MALSRLVIGEDRGGRGPLRLGAARGRRSAARSPARPATTGPRSPSTRAPSIVREQVLRGPGHDPRRGRGPLHPAWRRARPRPRRRPRSRQPVGPLGPGLEHHAVAGDDDPAVGDEAGRLARVDGDREAVGEVGVGARPRAPMDRRRRASCSAASSRWRVVMPSAALVSAPATSGRPRRRRPRPARSRPARSRATRTRSRRRAPAPGRGRRSTSAGRRRGAGSRRRDGT